MALNYELFRKVVAPEFAAMSDADLDLFAAEAECEITEKKWLKRYDRGVALLTAHLIKIAPNSASESDVSGVVNKIKVGQLEKGYAVNADADGYDRSSYGMEFKRLRKQVLMGPIFVSC